MLTQTELKSKLDAAGIKWWQSYIFAGFHGTRYFVDWQDRKAAEKALGELLNLRKDRQMASMTFFD